VVNNVETLASVVKVILNGGRWYSSYGTRESTGTKLLSISGDCRYPGIYEVAWGFSVNDVLDMTGAINVQAVQVGGPSGALIGREEFDRILSYEDLATGGSIIVFDQSRDLLNDVVANFTDFFIDESCGSCIPCRGMTVLLKQKLDKILNARGVKQDINDLVAWSKLMKLNRCGLGQTAANPILTSIKNFRHLYFDKIQNNKDFDTGFDLSSAVVESCLVTNRKPTTEDLYHDSNR
jgi:[NiFe] hydrogenase diaphorase moiety large subunit